MTKGLVSIVVPTCKNKPGMTNPVDRCLTMLALSTYKNIEIICVDEGKERSEQRNIGIKQAKGEYILYLDDDQYVSSKLLAECVELIKKCDAIYIPEVIVTDDWFGKLRDWERQFYTGTAVDCVRFFKADGCPTFDTSLRGPEDADFDHKIKGKKLISHNCLYHLDNVSVIDYLKKKSYYSESMGRYHDKWPTDKVLDWKWRCCGVFFERGLWMRLLRRPHYAVAMFALIFLRGVIYLWKKRG